MSSGWAKKVSSEVMAADWAGVTLRYEKIEAKPVTMDWRH